MDGEEGEQECEGMGMGLRLGTRIHVRVCGQWQCVRLPQLLRLPTRTRSSIHMQRVGWLNGTAVGT